MKRLHLPFALGLVMAIGSGVTVTALSEPVAPPPVINLNSSQKADLSALQDYLNGVKTLKAEFDQYAPDGAMTTGTFVLARPGHLRFDYDPPSEVLIVADGYWVTMVDSYARQLSRWPINDTPLGVLVKKDINLSQDVDILGLEDNAGVIRLTVADKKEPGKGLMTLVFTKGPLELRQWQIKDAQGQVTTVTLSDARQNVAVDPSLFTYKDPRPVQPFRPGLHK